MEADGTLSRAVYAQLKMRINDNDRVHDLMGTMSAMGMIYFSSIAAATEALVERDLRIQNTEAALVVDAWRKAVAELEEPVRQQPTVMVARQSQARKAQEHSTKKGANYKALATKALAKESTLRADLKRQSPPIKPKPRRGGVVDEVLWQGSVETIKERLSVKHCISDLDTYYMSMCNLGKSLLLAEVHREAQGLYDYRASKLQYRANRKKQ